MTQLSSLPCQQWQPLNHSDEGGCGSISVRLASFKVDVCFVFVHLPVNTPVVRRQLASMHCIYIYVPFWQYKSLWTFNIMKPIVWSYSLINRMLGALWDPTSNWLFAFHTAQCVVLNIRFNRTSKTNTKVVFHKYKLAFVRKYLLKRFANSVRQVAS